MVQKFQRKSLAPSNLARFGKEPSFKPPLINPEPPKKLRKCKENTENAPPVKMSVSDHEAMIQKILSKPFKVPIFDYIPERTTKSLGVKRIFIRR